MVFIDDLAFELFTLTLVGVVSIYLKGNAYIWYRKGMKEIETIMRTGAFILTIIVRNPCDNGHKRRDAVALAWEL